MGNAHCTCSNDNDTYQSRRRFSISTKQPTYLSRREEGKKSWYKTVEIEHEWRPKEHASLVTWTVNSMQNCWMVVIIGSCHESNTLMCMCTYMLALLSSMKSWIPWTRMQMDLLSPQLLSNGSKYRQMKIHFSIQLIRISTLHYIAKFKLIFDWVINRILIGWFFNFHLTGYCPQP